MYNSSYESQSLQKQFQRTNCILNAIIWIIASDFVYLDSIITFKKVDAMKYNLNINDGIPYPYYPQMNYPPNNLK